MTLRFATATDETYRQPLMIRQLLGEASHAAAAQEIVYRDTVRLTYRDLIGRIGRLASALAALGVTEGSTVAVLDWDSHRYLEAYFAVPMMGAVLMTANIRLSPAQLQYTLAHSEAEVLLVHRDFLPPVEALRADLPAVRAIVVLADGAGAALPDWAAGEYEALLADASPDHPFEDFDENALATSFYTTGTTGLPKAVCFSHRQLVLHTLAVSAALAAEQGPGLRRGDVYLPLTPMFHVHAWGMPYVATMLGVKQVYPGRYEPELICALKRNEGVTFSHCVPTVLRMVIDAARAADVSLDGWLMVIGGSALNRELHDEGLAAGLSILAGYGMSETGPVICIARHGEDPHAAIRSGTPIPLVAARVVDDAMTPLANDDRAVGELVLRAPWLTPCYVGNAEASGELWRGGWLHTHDLATIDPQGSIQIRDRLKDVIKTGGEWIGSLTLEDIIARHDDVAEVAVVGVPDPKWQERPVAVIVPAPGRAPGLKDINGLLEMEVRAGRISRYALMDAVIVRDALPKTSVGKIDKKLLRAELAAMDA